MTYKNKTLLCLTVGWIQLFNSDGNVIIFYSYDFEQQLFNYFKVKKRDYVIDSTVYFLR